MPNEAPVAEPSLLNEPAKAAPVEATPESKLFPETPAEPTPAPAKAEPEPKPAEPEPKKEEPKEEPSKPSPEAKPTVDYENLKLPEGSLLSDNELAAVKKEAKEKGLTLEQAQGILGVKNDAVKSYAANQNEVLVTSEKKWREEWKNDPDFGGDKYEESTELAKRAASKIADPVLMEWLDKTRLGSFPPVMRMFARIGRLFSEDQLTRGSVGGAPREIPPEERMYGRTTSGAEEK